MRRPPLAPILSCFLLTACVEETDAKRGFPWGTGELILRATPEAELASLEATLVGVQLIRFDESLAPDQLLEGETRVELVGLEGQAAWLDLATLPLGTFRGLQLEFEPGSASARAKDGTAVTVALADTTLEARFAAPRKVGRSSYLRLSVDVDLPESLSGTLPSLVFDPRGAAEGTSASAGVSLDELRGTAAAWFGGPDFFLDAYVDDDLERALTTVSVFVDPDTGLFDATGAAYPSHDAFFDELEVGETLYEVQGVLGAQGILFARLVTVEGLVGGLPQYPAEVKFEGAVVGHPAGALELAWAKIESGRDVALPVLGSLGDPAVLVADVSGDVVYVDEDGADLDLADLDVGERVEVVFPVFDGVEFGVSRVRRLRAPTGEVALTSVDVVAESAVATVRADEPWVVSGEVADDTTPVALDLAESALVLATRTRASLELGELVAGLAARARGPLDPGTQEVTVDELFVRPGRLVGTVADATPPTTFVVDLVEAFDPFGGGVGPTGPYRVQIDPDGDVRGAADSAESLLALFDALEAGQSLVVEVQGVGTSIADEIVAFELDVELVTR